jgi:hypothetical protein
LRKRAAKKQKHNQLHNGNEKGQQIALKTSQQN